MPDKNGDRRRSERARMESSVEFFVDAEIVTATSVDLSETGLKFSSRTPVHIRLRMEVDGDVQERQSELVWARREEDGTMTYGLRFVPDPPEYHF